MVDPPASATAVHDTVAEELDAVTDTPVGAAGVPYGITASDCTDEALECLAEITLFQQKIAQSLLTI